jgi:ABC-type uncharacterized transport system substrate-binding protein
LRSIGPGRLPTYRVFGSVKTFIEHGALIGVVVDYAKLGKVVAGIVHRHQQGVQLRHIPVQIVKEPLLVINRTSSEFQLDDSCFCAQTGKHG